MKNKLKLIPEGICLCKLCETLFDLKGKDDEIDTCLCGPGYVTNGMLEGAKVEVTWTCEECGYKNKDIKSFKVSISK